MSLVSVSGGGEEISPLLSLGGVDAQRTGWLEVFVAWGSMMIEMPQKHSPNKPGNAGRLTQRLYLRNSPTTTPKISSSPWGRITG